jgi:cell division septal protein FtsQ
MASSKKLKSRVSKSKKLNKSRFPRWTKFAVVGLVAVVGIVVIFNTFAASSLPVNTTKVINGGSVSDENSSSSMARSPITLEPVVCRILLAKVRPIGYM